MRSRARLAANVITGKTRLFCIVADPIEHVRTPEVFNALLAERGVDGVHIPLHVNAEALPAVVSALRGVKNLQGINVTIPHKVAMMALCDEVEPSAKLIGAVNIVRRDPDGRLIGANFDGSGFVAGLEEATGPVRGRAIYMVGAGGAARAIAFGLAQAGASRLMIQNRDATKARDLANSVKQAFPGVDTGPCAAIPDGTDIAVNATSLGLRPEDPVPMDVTRLRPPMVVAEVIMRPAMTVLLRKAQDHGCRIVTGERMFHFQVAALAAFVRAE
jgi:shikimate dehydrogenase